jgi:hypothetical protein
MLYSPPILFQVMEMLSATMAAASSDAAKGALLLMIWVMCYDPGFGVKLGD